MYQHQRYMIAGRVDLDFQYSISSVLWHMKVVQKQKGVGCIPPVCLRNPLSSRVNTQGRFY